LPTPFSVDLVCIPPNRINEFWPLVRDRIRVAIETTGLSPFSETERQVLNGEQLLWLAWSDQIEAAATTHLSDNVCTIVACSGHCRERWLPLLAKIENYARNEGCRCMRLFGRRGWERALKDYRVEHIVMEKVL
jgi:hypothetical protein